MKKNHKAKPGDIFKIPVESEVYYLQYLMNDYSLFNSNVVRAFNYKSNVNEIIDLKELVQKEVKFIAHTMIKGGVKLCNWEKIGNIPIDETFEPPTFRATDDVFSEVKKSNKWFVWKAGEQERKIGKLNNEFKSLPYGTIYHPIDITEWLKTGSHGFMYPE